MAARQQYDSPECLSKVLALELENEWGTCSFAATKGDFNCAYLEAN